MDFSQMPDNCFLRILSYLPLNEQVRSERVSKLFQFMSSSSVADTKFLNLDDDEFRELWPDDLSKVLNLCSEKLERLKLPTKNWDHSAVLAYAFSKFDCSRLIELDLGCAEINCDVLMAILKNNRNLKTLTLTRCDRISGRQIDIDNLGNLIFEKLESLEIGNSNNFLFRSMTGRVPNLKRLRIKIAFSISAEIFDDFFAACPKLESLLFDDVRSEDIDFPTLTHFWHLSSLRNLKLNLNGSAVFGLEIDDRFLTKTSTAFPRLESLHLIGLNVTNRGVAALTSLENLRKLTLSQRRRF